MGDGTLKYTSDTFSGLFVNDRYTGEDRSLSPKTVWRRAGPRQKRGGGVRADRRSRTKHRRRQGADTRHHGRAVQSEAGAVDRRLQQLWLTCALRSGKKQSMARGRRGRGGYDPWRVAPLSGKEYLEHMVTEVGEQQAGHTR